MDFNIITDTIASLLIDGTYKIGDKQMIIYENECFKLTIKLEENKNIFLVIIDKINKVMI